MKRSRDVDFAQAQAAYFEDIAFLEDTRDRQVREATEAARTPPTPVSAPAYPISEGRMFLDSEGNLRYDFFFDGKWLSEA